MSDFLTNLVSRSFGSASGVRPRLTSLFEPVREDTAKFRDAAEMKHGEALEVVQDEVSAENANSDEERPKSRVARIAGRGDKHHDEVPAPDELPKQPIVASLPRLVREPQQVLSAERMESNELALPIRRNAPDRTPSMTAITESESHLTKPVSASPAVLPAAREPQPEKSRHDLLIPPKLTSEMRLPELALSARQDRKSYEKERDLLSGPSQPAEQTVNVTIGRIEVRATKENTHSSRQASPSPVMSLEEYLRKRARQASS